MCGGGGGEGVCMCKEKGGQTMVCMGCMGHHTYLALAVLSKDCLQHALHCTSPVSVHIMTVLSCTL